MEQPKDNVIVLTPGDAIPEGTENSVKILLLGSIDTREDRKFDWAGKFIAGICDITDPEKGLIQYQGFNFTLINGTVPSPINGTPNLFNNDFITKTNWIYQMISECDAIFFNFLKNSVASIPLFWFGYCCSSGKMVVRCSEEYCNYPIVKLSCASKNIPLLPGKVGSVLNALNSIAAFTPKFQEIMKYQMPE